MAVKRRTTATRRPAARTKRATTARRAQRTTAAPTGTVKVFVHGREQAGRVGAQASDYGKEGSSYVLMGRGGRTQVVNGTHVLVAGDTLVVSQRGVGG